MNKVIICGRLTKDAEVRYTQGAEPMAVARFTTAVGRKYAKNKQEDGQTADFISCVAFGKRAEMLEKYGKKGKKFIIEGRIQTGSYDKDGQKVYTTDVVVEQIEFAESKGANDGADAPSAPDGASFMDIPNGINDEIPFD